MMKTCKIFTFAMLFCLGATAEAQVTFTMQNSLLTNASGGSDCVVDMNGDHLDDVVGVSGNNLYINFQQLDGTFDEQVFVLPMQNSPSWSICAADLDNNGYTDLLFGGGQAVSFIMASDDGTSYEEQYIDDYIFCQRSTIQDIDLDGDLDAFVCHDVDLSHPYRNDGNGNMVEDQSLIQTLDLPGNYAAMWCDYDNDGDSDLYITKCRQGAQPGDPARTNGLYQNNGDGTFTEVAEAANMADNDQSWTTAFEDFDNDGDFDAYTVNHDFANRFMQNNGDGTFTDIIETTGIAITDLGAWNMTAGDFDNNGFVDIFSEMSKEMYYNNGDGTFTGADHVMQSGGVGDLNNDGFLDVATNGTAIINDGNDNNWVKFNLEGVESNSHGIGARVEIYGDWGIQIREVRAGTSFAPMSSLTTHFGLGQATEIDQVIIKWPLGIITVLDDIDINTTHNIPEFGCVAEAVELNSSGGTILCIDETITLTAPDGFESYTWSNGANTQSIDVSSSGGYSCNCFLADGCVSLSNNVAIQEFDPTPPAIDIDGDLEFCEGHSVILTAPNLGTYSWSNGETTQSIEVEESGDYIFSITTPCGDITSETITVSVDDMVEPVATGLTITEAQSVTLTASGTEMEWYDVPVGGEPVGFGESLETPVIDADATYYVESHFLTPGDVVVGGKEDNSGTGGIPTSGGYLTFEAYESFTIQEVTVYNEGIVGERTIQLYGPGGLEAEMVVNIDQAEQILVLNFVVEGPGNYSLRCSENNLFRNSSGANYPYELGGAGAITGTSWGSLSYYYYFYNWKVLEGEQECISDRVPVQILFVGLEELADQIGLTVYPLPAYETLTLSRDLSESTALVELLDLSGKVILSERWTGTMLNLDIERLAAGTYVLRYADAQINYHQQVVVK